MKVYTKTGDGGKTSLIGGKRVAKNHKRIEAYGSVDELMAHISLLRDQEIHPQLKEVLLEVLDRLMTCATVLATEGDIGEIKLPAIFEEDIVYLEKAIDKLDDELPPLRLFIIPGGHAVVSQCHVARTVCRRVERVIIDVSENFEVPKLVLKYINRLSDYLFVLSRKLSKDFNIDEITWQPRL